MVAYLVAVNPDLTPKWASTLQNRSTDGCLTGEQESCSRAIAALLIDESKAIALTIRKATSEIRLSRSLIVLCVGHRIGDPLHTIGKVRAETSLNFTVALSPERTMRCVIRVRKLNTASNSHSNAITAPSRGISMINASSGQTSRISHLKGPRPGSRVVPHEPCANGPSS